MLDVRSPVILAAAPVGLLLAAAGWLAMSGGSVSALDQEAARLSALPSVQTAYQRDAGAALVLAMARPLFAPLAQAQVRLDGVARSPGRAAALMSINGGAPQWVTEGVTVGGVTLTRVGGGRVTIETASGAVEVALGETVGSAPGAAPTVVTTNEPAAPQGRRGLEPASAPGM